MELAVAAAFLRQQGDDVVVIDLFGSAPGRFEEKSDHYMQGLPISTAANGIIEFAEAFLLFAISSMSHGELLRIARAIRSARPEAIIVVMENSQAVTAYALDPLANDFFAAGSDALVCGEIYGNWEAIKVWMTDAAKAAVPANLITPQTEALKRPVERLPPIGSGYPVPAWELFPHDEYWRLPYAHGPRYAGRYLPILTSRGCPYGCDFCVSPTTTSRRWKGRPPDEVVAEILTLRDCFNVRYFQVEDLNPTVDGGRWREIARLLIEKNAGIRFAFVSGTKAETIALDDLSLLARAGCCYLSISPETGSAKLLKTIGKSFAFDHALALVRRGRELSVETQACFIVGHPAETEDDHQCSLELLKRLVRAGLSEAAFFIVSSVAGSRIHRERMIRIRSPQALPSFSPKGREGWQKLERRRDELIRVFFLEKLKQGMALWIQGLRALGGQPRTKMENLPQRILFVLIHILKAKLIGSPTAAA
jgi:hypothetical protein